MKTVISIATLFLFFVCGCNEIDQWWNAEKYEAEKKARDKAEKIARDRQESLKKIAYSLLEAMSKIEDSFMLTSVQYDYDNHGVSYYSEMDESGALKKQKEYKFKKEDFIFPNYIHWERCCVLKSASSIDSLYAHLDNIAVRVLDGELKTETRQTLKERHKAAISKWNKMVDRLEEERNK